VDGGSRGGSVDSERESFGEGGFGEGELVNFRRFGAGGCGEGNFPSLYGRFPRFPRRERARERIERMVERETDFLDLGWYSDSESVAVAQNELELSSSSSLAVGFSAVCSVLTGTASISGSSPCVAGKAKSASKSGSEASIWFVDVKSGEGVEPIWFVGVRAP
jgi:hypothetical protein